MRFIQTSILLLTFIGSTSATPITNLFNFGDSYSDTGNVQQVFGFPIQPYSEGRFTGEFTNGDDGKIWYDIVANKLGFSSQNSISGGNNYAFGGALTGGAPGPGTLPSLLLQTQLFLSDVGGVADSGALYSVWGGGNDVRINDIGSSVANISSVITQLNSAGAMNFFLPNLPNAGLSPESLKGLAPGGSAAEITAASFSFNAQLLNELQLLETNLGVNIIKFDTFSLFNDITLNPTNFGFSNVTDACYDGALGIGGPGTLCADPDSYLFFDNVHTTAAAHTLLGNLAYASIIDSMSVPVPTPASFPLLIMGLVILGFRRIRA